MINENNKAMTVTKEIEFEINYNGDTYFTYLDVECGCVEEEYYNGGSYLLAETFKVDFPKKITLMNDNTNPFLEVKVDRSIREQINNSLEYLEVEI